MIDENDYLLDFRVKQLNQSIFKHLITKDYQVELLPLIHQRDHRLAGFKIEASIKIGDNFLKADKIQLNGSTLSAWYATAFMYAEELRRAFSYFSEPLLMVVPVYKQFENFDNYKPSQYFYSMSSFLSIDSKHKICVEFDTDEVKASQMIFSPFYSILRAPKFTVELAPLFKNNKIIAVDLTSLHESSDDEFYSMEEITEEVIGKIAAIFDDFNIVTIDNYNSENNYPNTLTYGSYDSLDPQLKTTLSQYRQSLGNVHFN